MLVHRVDAVDGDAGFAAGAPAHGNARVAGLGGIKRAALVNFDAGFQAGEFQIVPPVERQFGDLARIHDPADRGLLRVDGRDLTARHFDGDRFRTHRHVRVNARSLADLDSHTLDFVVPKPLDLDDEFVVSGEQRRDDEKSLFVGCHDAFSAIRERGGAHGCARDDRA